MTCAIDDCSERAVLRGFCRNHYRLQYKAGLLPDQAPCQVKDCNGKAYARGACYTHYQAGARPSPPKKTKPMSDWHRITQADSETMLGDCSVCGPMVPLWLNGLGVGCKKAARTRRQYAQYQLTEEADQALIARANGRCELCGCEAKLNTDHNHETGMVRGLLCHNCNVGLGLFKDNVDVLLSAVRWIQHDGPA